MHFSLYDCKSFDVELSLNKRALPPVMQHAYMQTEAAPPVADGEPAHLTIAMIEDTFK